MMNSVNLIGRLTRDAYITNPKSDNGKPVALFTLAVNRGRKDSDGNQSADFIPCQLHGRAVENIAQYLTKGKLISFSGSLNVYQSTTEKLSTGYPVTMFSVSGFNVDLLSHDDSNGQNSRQQSNARSGRPATSDGFNSSMPEPDDGYDLNF